MKDCIGRDVVMTGFSRSTVPIRILSKKKRAFLVYDLGPKI